MGLAQILSAKFFARKVQRIQRTILKWGKENYADFPWRSTTNPFHALIAEIMLQRTRAEQVLPVYEKFTSKYQFPHEVAAENPDKIRNMLSSLGLGWRIEKVIQLTQMLTAIDNKIPDTKDKLMELPGIGEYAASAFLSLHAGVRMPIVDSNVVRLWSRLFCFKKDKEIRRKKGFLDFVDKITPEENFREFNYSVLDFTRAVCRPKPLHNICPLVAVCSYYRDIHKLQYSHSRKNHSFVLL